MNVGISSSQYSSITSSPFLKEGLPSDPPVDNRGTVLKPVSALADSAEAKSATENQARLVDDGLPDSAQSELQKSAQQQLKEQRLEEQQQKVEQQQIQQLAARDREVRNHERAHAAVGGQYAGAPQYQYQRGPDGVNYAVSGEVSISTGGVSGDPQATIEKAQVIRRAALAPAEPSAQDRKVAAQATQMEAQARVELADMQREERLAEQEESKANQASDGVNTQTNDDENRTSSEDDKPKPFFSEDEQAEQRKAFNQQVNELNRRIVSATYSEPGSIFSQIV